MSGQPLDDMQADLDRFAHLVAERLGFQAHATGHGALAAALRERLHATGRDTAVGTYLDRLATAAAGDAEWRALGELLTIGETYFFRTPDHFRALTDVALPARLRDRAQSRRLRLLSAGCASGEEAYTLAILVSEALALQPGWQVEITGIDLNPAFLRKAALGRYTEWSLRSTSAAMRDRYFRPEGRAWRLDERVRSMVRFEERNMLHDDPAFWQAGAFDIIFCRNVGIYFTPDALRQVVARFAHALAPGGYLFLGPAETLRGLSRDFKLCHTHDTFYYELRNDGPATPAIEPAAPAVTPAPVAGQLPPEPTWVAAIQRASQRIAELAVAPPGPATRPSPPVWDLATAMDLFGQERFAEALAHLRTLPPEAGADPDVLMLLAAVLTNAGDCAEGERVCRQVLAIDELSAGAHYLLALCKEQAGDLPGAIRHGQTAAYLDPHFAMARLHLGLMAKRAEDRETARHELAAALALLPHEDAARVLLFGGGFGRETLQTLCQAELASCGGAP